MPLIDPERVQFLQTYDQMSMRHIFRARYDFKGYMLESAFMVSTEVQESMDHGPWLDYQEQYIRRELLKNLENQAVKYAIALPKGSVWEGQSSFYDAYIKTIQEQVAAENEAQIHKILQKQHEYNMLAMNSKANAAPELSAEDMVALMHKYLTPPKPVRDTYREKAASEFEGVDELDPKLWGEGVDGFF